MTLTLPQVAAPQATPPAARPVRAAGAAGGAAATFDEALARSSGAPDGDLSAAESGNAAGMPADEVTGERDVRQSGGDAWPGTAWISVAMPSLPAAGSAVEAADPGPVVPAAADEAAGDAADTAAQAVAGRAEEELATQPTSLDAAEALVAAADGPARARDEASPVPPQEGEPAAPGRGEAPPVPTRDEAPTASARRAESAASPIPAVAGRTIAATPSETGIPVSDHDRSSSLEPADDGRATAAARPPAQAERGRAAAVRPRPVDTEAQRTARALLGQALADRQGVEASQASARASQAVATPALVAASPFSPAAASERAAALEQAVDVGLTDEEVAGGGSALRVPVGEQSGQRSSGERSGQGAGSDGQSQLLGRGTGSPPAVPASMVFPGHATFAAALEHATPLGGATPPAFSSSSLQTVVPQVVRAVQVQVAAGGGDMTLTLAPAHLGTVTIEVRVEQQRVLATLSSDTPGVRGWMAAHEQDLKAGLAEIGLQLDELVVREDGRRQGREREEPPADRRRRPKTEPEPDAIFDVRV